MEILHSLIFVWFGFGAIMCGSMMLYNGGSFSVFPYFVLILGIILVFLGGRKTLRNILTRKKGVEKYGIVIGCYGINTFNNVGVRHDITGTYYRLKVLVIADDESAKSFKEISVSKYDVGTFLKLKYYKNDINIIDKVDNKYVPDSEKYKLNFEYNKYIKNNNI